ncbi:MAG: hypothetical protein AAB372_03900 [Patescibacteria group bacterium]
MKESFCFIAEVKTQSPFGFRAAYSWDVLFELANMHGDILSIHTDLRWGGSWELLQKARRLTKKPILAKGIHAHDDDIKRAVDCGADWILAVGRIPTITQEKLVVEPDTLEELKSIPGGLRVVWNSRDLKAGGLKKELFPDAREIWSGWLCQASNIKSIEDVNLKADAVLVGTYLKEFIESLKKTREI